MIRIRHLTTGSSDQVGGIASVVRDSTVISENGEFKVSSHFFDRGRFQDSRFEVLDTTWRRIRHKINRLCARDPTLHPYRYPSINVDHFDRGNVANADVLHVHKPSLWKRAVQITNKPDGPALVVHAHSVDGFTGGCVLEQDCPQLGQGCRNCPIVPPSLQWLPPRGLRIRARQLHSGRPVIVANSRATLNAIERSGIIPEGLEREIIYPAVDGHRFYSDPPAEKNEDSSRRDGSFQVGFISYSVENPNKGFPKYVEALRQLRMERSVQGVVAGHCQAETRSAYPELTFTGVLSTAEELRRFYNTLDLLVVPSVSESFGKVSVEAQFCGTPVVCYDSGGLPETVLDGVTGRVTDKNTPTCLAKAAGTVLAWTHIHEQFESDDTQEFLTQFDADTIAGQYRSLYQRLHEAQK